jgi:hypothetical protein
MTRRDDGRKVTAGMTMQAQRRARQWWQRPSQGMSSTGMTNTAEGHQGPASFSVCLSVRPLLLLCQKGDEELYCTATGAKPARACLKPIQAEDQSIDSLSLVRQSHLPHPPLPHPRDWGSRWIWCNLCSAHLRHLSALP